MIVRFLADEDLDSSTIQCLRSANRQSIFSMLKNAGLRGVKDPSILDVAAQQGRILIPHDQRTMTRFFLDRVANGKPAPGLFIVPQRAVIADVIESLLLIWAASQESEWRDLIVHLPLR